MVSIYNFRTTWVAGQEIYCAGTQQQNHKKLRMYGFYLQFQDNLSGRTRNLLCRDPAGQLEWHKKSIVQGPSSRITRNLGCMVSFQDNLSGRTRKIVQGPSSRITRNLGCMVSIYNFRTTWVAGQEIYCAGTQQQNHKKLRMYGFYLLQDNLSGRTRNLLCRDPAAE